MSRSMRSCGAPNSPTDFFSRGTGQLSSAQYFAFWSALERESDRDALPVAVAGALSAESFDPADLRRPV